MSLTNPNTPVSQQDLQDFYHKLLPYIGSSDGHTIENSESVSFEQRDTLQFNEGFTIEDDNTNKKTIISPDTMQSGDINDIITPLPSVQQKYHKYSTEEQIVGEWIDGKPLYQKTIDFGALPNNTTKDVQLNVSNIKTIVDIKGVALRSGAVLTIPRCYSNNAFNIDISANTSMLSINTAFDYSSYSAIITVQYTKTTD